MAFFWLLVAFIPFFFMVISGAEEIKCWEPCEGTVRKCVLSNGLFGRYNPYTTLAEGDWFIASFVAHTGEVYLNEKRGQGDGSPVSLGDRRTVPLSPPGRE